VVQYDNVINRHRKVVYTIRRRILGGEDIKGEIERLLEEKVRDLTYLPGKNNPKFVDNFEAIIPLGEKKIADIAKEKKDKVRFALATAQSNALYKKREKELGTELMRGLERDVYLQIVDVLWMQHLENMQHLREGIHWRSVGQRDPLVEYRSESQKLFESLQRTLRDEVLRTIFHVKKEELRPAKLEDDVYESDLTKAAASAVEQGVNELGDMSTHIHDDDFKVKKAASQKVKSDRKKTAKKKRKSARASRKRH
jgi:preprotein translocase subunit SecA